MTRTEIEAEAERLEGVVSLAVAQEMRRVALEWKAAHPRRSIQFEDTMGLAAWQVDGRPLGHWLIQPDALESVFAPLLDALNWYLDIHSDRRLDPVEFEV